MDTFLGFLSDLILFTFGLLVVIFWITILIGIAVESYDFFFKKAQAETAEEDE